MAGEVIECPPDADLRKMDLYGLCTPDNQCEGCKTALHSMPTPIAEGIDPPPFPLSDNRTVDYINHSKHYKGKKFESIDIIEDFELGFHLGNAIKYILRAGKKGNKIQDLKKAIWYLERECVNVVGATADFAYPTQDS